MNVEAWKLDGDQWVLYCEDPERAEEAVKSPELRWMGTYYRRGSGEPSAWQFAGSKEAVLAVARRKQSGGPA